MHRLAQRAIADRQLDVHLGLTSEPGHAHPEGAPVGPDGLTEGVDRFQRWFRQRKGKTVEFRKQPLTTRAWSMAAF